MKPLKRELNEKHDAIADQPVPAAGSGIPSPGAPGLIIRKLNKELWVLPWAYFLGARYLSKAPPANTPQQDSELERILLTFAHQLVTVTGRNLEVLMDMIALLQLDVLRELPKEFLETEEEAPHAAPIIIGIDVQEREK